MTFFNRQEDVISIELTQYGKRLLASGEFNPVYYSFSDDSIIYDSEYCNNSENHNDISNRINNLIPSMKPLYNLTSVEENSDTQGTRDTNNRALQTQLSNAEVGTRYIPAVQIKVLSGMISGSVDFLTGACPTERIPQITFQDVLSRTYVSRDTGSVPAGTFIYPDGSSLRVHQEYLLLDISELNAPDGVEDFTIELFELVDEDTSGRIYTPGPDAALYYIREVPKRLTFANDGLSGRVGEFYEDQPQVARIITPKSAEYFFDIKIDEEIDPSILAQPGDQRRVLDKKLPRLYEGPDQGARPC